MLSLEGMKAAIPEQSIDLDEFHRRFRPFLTGRAEIDQFFKLTSAVGKYDSAAHSLYPRTQ